MIFSSAPNDWLMHYGIKGQKWGIRRYQNPDGTLTAEGRKRYGLNNINLTGKENKDLKNLKKKLNNAKNMMAYEIMDQDYEELQSNNKFKSDYKKLFDDTDWRNDDFDSRLEELMDKKYPKYKDVSKVLIPWDEPNWEDDNWLWNQYHPEEFNNIPNNYYNRASTLLAIETSDIQNEALRKYGKDFVNKLNLKVDKMYEY